MIEDRTKQQELHPYSSGGWSSANIIFIFAGGLTRINRQWKKDVCGGKGGDEESRAGGEIVAKRVEGRTKDAPAK